jgi:predicted dehydrogenase
MTLRAPLRVGVIGAGVFAGLHAGKIAANPDAALAGVHDIDSARAQGLAASHGAPAFDALDSLLGACEAVVVASAAVAHEAQASAVLAAGRHAYVEKPLAATGAGATALARTAAARGLVLQTGHQERFVAEALGLFAAPTPRRIEAIREGTPGPRGLDTSVTLDLMIHDLELAIALLGPVERVIGARASARSDGGADAIEAEVAFANGATARFVASRVAPARRRLTRIDWGDGSAEVDFLTRAIVGDASGRLNPGFAEACPDPLGEASRRFVAAARGDAPPALDPSTAAAAAVLAEAIDQIA